MIKSRIIKLIEYKRIPKEEFYKKIGVTSANFRGNAKKTPLNSNAIENIITIIPDVNPEWLLTGKGVMLKSNESQAPRHKIGVQFYDPENKPKNRKLIPFYEDIATIGGVNDQSVDVNTVSAVSEWIDAGDWFRDATAAIRHYGDSMTEYPSGCILALKEVNDRQLLLWGKNYCIETTEFRITKQLQPGKDKKTILAYSTNRENHPDGRLIHAPVSIPVDSIRSIFLVLGCVVKEYSSGAVFIRK